MPKNIVVQKCRKIFREDSTSGKRGTASASTLTIHIERQNLNVVQFFKKYTTKSESFDRSSNAKIYF